MSNDILLPADWPKPIPPMPTQPVIADAARHRIAAAAEFLISVFSIDEDETLSPLTILDAKDVRQNVAQWCVQSAPSLVWQGLNEFETQELVKRFRMALRDLQRNRH